MIFRSGEMRLPPGKIPPEILKEVVFRNLGAKRREVIVGPSAGIDGAVIDVAEKSFVVSMDPITGAVEHIGWLAVNINANDVATFGVKPSFLLSSILLSENGDRRMIETISADMNRAATKLKIAIIGGHCEVTPGLRNPVVTGCMIGMTNRGNYVTAAGGKAGDKIILTKTAGIEGTSILAFEKEKQLKRSLRPRIISQAKTFYKQISVVKDAITAFNVGGVHAMHDPTEGGIAGGINEMADASNLGVKIFKQRITVRQETLEICDFFQIDPLQLIASGSLLIAVDPQKASKVLQNLVEKGITASIIGEFLPDSERRILVSSEGETRLARPATDHLWRALAHGPDREAD